MAQFKTKFQNGDIVSFKKNGIIAKVRHYDSYSGYFIESKNGGKFLQYARASQLEFVSRPEPKISVIQLVAKALNLQENDIVTIKAAFNPEQCIALGDEYTDWTDKMTDSIGKNFRVADGSSYNGRYLLRALDDTYSQYFPAFAIEIVERTVVLTGSSDYKAYLSSQGVIIANVLYSFEMFDRLYQAVNKRRGKKGIKSYNNPEFRIEGFNNRGVWNGTLGFNAIQVGCQTFRYRHIDVLMEEIQKIRAATS